MILVAGYNRHRQLISNLNDPENKQRINPPQIVNIGINIRSFSIYAHHSVKIDDNGQAYGIGKDINFRIGTPNRTTYSEFTQINFDGINEKFISAFCGTKFTLYVTETYKLILCCELDKEMIPRIFTLHTKPVSLFGGIEICSIIDENGDIYIINPSQLFEDLNSKKATSPDFYHLQPSLHLPTPAIEIACGSDRIFTLTNDGQIFLNKIIQRKTIEEHQLIKIQTASKIIHISGTSNSFFAVDIEGKVYGFSTYQKFNQLGTTNSESSKKFVLIESLFEYSIESAFCGIGHSFFITKNGEVFSCGSNRFRQLMIKNFNETLSPIPLKVDVDKPNRPVFVIVGNAITVVFLNSVPKHCPNQRDNLVMKVSTPSKKVSLKRFKPKVYFSDSPENDSVSKQIKNVYAVTTKPKITDKKPKSISVPSSPTDVKKTSSTIFKSDKDDRKKKGVKIDHEKSSSDIFESDDDDRKSKGVKIDHVKSSSTIFKSDKDDRKKKGVKFDHEKSSSDIFESDDDDRKSKGVKVDLKKELKKKEAENDELRKKTEMLIRILQKKKLNDEKQFISFDELKDIHHIEYLSRSPTNDISKACRTTTRNEYYTLKTFKTANFKEFQKFYREFEIISSIKHPSIIKFYRFTNSTDDIPYPLLIVEYLPFNLRDVIKKNKTDETFSDKPLTNTHKIEIIIDILFGLKFLHEKKQIMHRNLKPENILITKKYHAKIADFAWANSIEDDLNYSKKETGSMPYMAPELLNGDDYGEKIDQFSFGKILYFILSDGKEPPFNMNDIENGITFKRIPALNDLSAEIIGRCCDYEPENRPTFSEVIELIVKRKFLLLPNVDVDEVKNRMMKLEILEQVENP